VRLSFQTYWPLILTLFAIPYLWWMGRRTLSGMDAKQRILLSSIRSTIVVLLTLAAMQPFINQPGKALSLVYLLDVSKSISPPAVQSAIQWIQETDQKGIADQRQFIAFGSNAIQFESLDQLSSVQVANDASAIQSVDQSGTNIENALEQALHSFSPHHLKRLILLTDGNENSGQMVNEISRLKRADVHVYTVPMSVRANRDTWIERVMAPTHVAAEELFPIEVHVYSQFDTEGELDVKNGDKILGHRKVKLAKGINRVAFESSLNQESGPITVEAELRVPGDTFTENNRFRKSIVVQGKPKILYVESRAESAKYLKQALEVEGFDVNTASPAAMPEALAVLDSYDTLILSDVARSSLTPAQMNSIATYVHDLGGGFILAGGENNFGEGGYSETVIEEALPVTFDIKRKPDSVAMIVVFDKSASMGGLKLALAKEATKAAVQLLRPEKDSFGVVTFDYNAVWAISLQPVNAPAMTMAIDKIVASGETNAYPALVEAFNQLSPSKSQIKHVILLSDGRSLKADFETLTKKMAAAKITVSSVAVGNEADRELLEKIATWGMGRPYYVTDPSKVPQIFIDETQMAKGETLQEEHFKPEVKKNVEAFKGIDFKTAPELLGYVRTTPKETSEVLLEGGTNDPKDPILARWHYGLGKSVAFTSDLKDRWAVNWLRWDGYVKFWSQLVRQTMRQREDNRFALQVEQVQDKAKITINAVEDDGQFRNDINPLVRVIAPDQRTSELTLQQSGPGYYEATFPLSQKGSYLFRVADPKAGGPSRVLAYSYPDEYHFYPPNIDALRSLSTATGGKFQPGPQDIFDTSGETVIRPVPLWPYLVAVALALYICDVFLRRVKLFE